jgi:periplasmic protein TonB
MIESRSALTSLSIHVLAVLLLLGLVTNQVSVLPAPHLIPLDTHFLKPFVPNVAGGGQQAKLPTSKGSLPPRARNVFVPPMPATNPGPKLAMIATIDAPDHSNLPDIGDPNALGTILSGGPGSLGGIGIGKGPSVGSGERGVGVGSDGVVRPGAGVTMPVPIKRVEPEYSEEARKARANGTVIVYCEVGPDGKPHNLRISRSFGLGLDQEALKAVSQWLFRPGTKDGKPVTVAASIEVAFHLL